MFFVPFLFLIDFLVKPYQQDTSEDGHQTEGLALAPEGIIVSPAQSMRIAMKIPVVKENANNKMSTCWVKTTSIYPLGHSYMGEKNRKLGKMKSGSELFSSVHFSFLFFICYLLLLHRYGNLEECIFFWLEKSLLQDILRRFKTQMCGRVGLQTILHTCLQQLFHGGLGSRVRMKFN